MEGLPRISMISLDLKESNDAPDLSNLNKYIESHYHERSTNYKDAFKEFLNLRQSATVGVESLAYLANMKRYFSQLQLLKQRFPLSKDGASAINWSWEECQSSATVTMSDVRLEEAAVMYNIGCLHGNLGASERRIDLDSTKIACTHFQCAAWGFQSVLEHHTPVPSVDLECDVLRYLNLLMLAQAHECVLEKSMVDQRRAVISAKIAFQISDLYKQCQGLLQSENIGYTVNSKQYKLWKRTCILKEYLYHCLSYYYMALAAEDSHKYGEIIAWLKLAKEKLDKCAKPLKDLKSPGADETIRFVQDVVNGKFESAKKDNDFIYYEKVPEPEMLQPIKGALLLKGIGFDVNDSDICGQDIFKNLIPMETHLSSSIYSEKKAEILRTIQVEVEAKNREIDQFLADMHWSTDMFSLEDAKVPQELVNCAAFIATNGDEIANVKRIMQDISSISIEVEESLETLSDTMRSSDIDKSVPLWKKYEKEYKDFVSNFEEAKESNNQLREVFGHTLTDFKFVNQPLETVMSLLPCLAGLGESSDVRGLLGECRRLLAKIDEMRAQRESLVVDLRAAMASEDVTRVLLGCKSESEEARVIGECLAGYDAMVGYLRQNMAAQANIMDAVVEHNASIAEVNARIAECKAQREQQVARIVLSFNTYKSLVKKGEEGIDFYRKLGSKILSLQTNVASLIPKPNKIDEPPKPKEIVSDKPRHIVDYPVAGETNTLNHQYVPAPSPINQYSLPQQPVPRLKDYLKDRKSSQPASRSMDHQATDPAALINSSGACAINQYQHPCMPWGYLGPPSHGASNYAVSRPRDQNVHFRTTQNIQQPAASSEVGCSVYPNYCSLPRPSYSQSSSSMSTTAGNMATSIDNLASSNQFTIPYQQQPFYNPNVISMAHSFGTQQLHQYEFQPQQQQQQQQLYQPQYNNVAIDPQQYHNQSLPNQTPSAIYHQSHQYNDSVNYQSYYSATSPSSTTTTNGAITTHHNNNLNSYYQQPSSSSSSSSQPTNHYAPDAASTYYNQVQAGNISSPHQTNLFKDSLNSFSSAVAVAVAVAKTTSSNTDLLSSSPTNHYPASDNSSRAVLEPTVLTRQEIEDQKEEKRKQIYRKQISSTGGDSHQQYQHPLNDNLVLNKFIADAERFMKRVTEIVDTAGNRSLEQHWTALANKERAMAKKSSAIAKCSPMKNRVQDSLPYDENRVVLKEGKDDYINASHIVLQSIDECLPRFIAFQSPLFQTVSEFWTAVFEQGCELLVQLAQPCDKDDTSKARVVSYWPDAKGQFIMIGSKFEISVQSHKEKSGWSERILLVKHVKSNQSRSIWHFQVNNVSNKLPKSHDDFLSFVTELCGYYRQQRSLTKPIGISCMNGSSVSGVMILLSTALTIMEITGTFPDIDGILLSMWAQRRNLLDDKHQLAFVYKSVSKASSDMLSKRNIVIGPGRLVSSVAYGESHCSSSQQQATAAQPPSTAASTTACILDSIFTNQHIQLSDLSSAISKWTVKGTDDRADPAVDTGTGTDSRSIMVDGRGASDNKQETKVPVVPANQRPVKDIELPSSLKHLADPSAIDLTPTPIDRRKITKREFEEKMSRGYVRPAVREDGGEDPLRALDPIYSSQ